MNIALSYRAFLSYSCHSPFQLPTFHCFLLQYSLIKKDAKYNISTCTAAKFSLSKSPYKFFIAYVTVILHNARIYRTALAKRTWLALCSLVTRQF